MATVTTGETILAIQNRVEDASFDDMEVIPISGVKVFLRCHSNDDILKVLNYASDFFSMFLSNVHKWSSEDLRYEHNAWLRIYGTPTHAWNTNFFKLCVSNYGTFVKADDCTLDRGRIDYARILISTASLEVLNTTTTVLVDGCKFFIKIVEEWGCNLGEDAFLTEELSIIRVMTQTYNNMTVTV